MTALKLKASLVNEALMANFEDGSLELNYHSALTFGKLILALLVDLNSALFQSFLP